MKHPHSLKRQMGLGLAIGIVITWLVATLIATAVIRHELDEAFDSSLQETAQRLLSLAAIEVLSREDTQTSSRVAALVAHKELLTYRVLDAQGNVLLLSHDADLDDFPLMPSTGFSTTKTHRIYGESAISDTIYIEVAEPLEHRIEATTGALIALLSPLLALIPLSLLGVWWIVRRSMRSVEQLKDQIEARGEGDLSPVSATDLPIEISPIAKAVNLLMDRLRRVLDAERSFAANSAHELRTPIAAALAQTQRLIAEAPAGPLTKRAVKIEASLHHLTELSAKLLQLAKAEGGGLLAETQQDLRVILAHVVDGFLFTDKGRGRFRVINTGDMPLNSRMDPDAFGILMNNLVENALKHSRPESLIDIVIGADHSVSVRSEGEIVSIEVMARLKYRFERGETDTTGSGLGLAIADTIARGANARLDLYSPASDKPDGFEAKVTL